MACGSIGRALSRDCKAAWLAIGVCGLLGACVREADAGPAVAKSTAPSPIQPSAPSPVPSSVSSSGPSSGAVPKVRDGGVDSGPSDSALRTLNPADVRLEMRRARGRVLFVHVWASWCGPCLDELPLMNQFATAARARGAVVLSVSVDVDAQMITRIPALLRARAPGLTAAVARFDRPEQFTSLFSDSWEGTIPAMFAFDRAGKLHRGLVGEPAPTDLDALVAELLARPSSPPVPTPKARPKR